MKDNKKTERGKIGNKIIFVNKTRYYKIFCSIFYQFSTFSFFVIFQIELSLSLQTYRNSYTVYPKKLFLLTLSYNIKVKWDA